MMQATDVLVRAVAVAVAVALPENVDTVYLSAGQDSACFLVLAPASAMGPHSPFGSAVTATSHPLQ